MILRFSIFKKGELGKKGWANERRDAVEDGVDEGGGQRVGVEQVGVVEVCHTLNVRFQCADGRNQYICKFLYCLKRLIHLAELFECLASENVTVTEVGD